MSRSCCWDRGVCCSSAGTRWPLFVCWDRNAVGLWVSAARRPRKPDSGHTGIISITVQMLRASQNAMKPGSSAF